MAHQLNRLMFAQGGKCFFCSQPLARIDASVEHLVAQTHGGSDSDENCVACCKGLNNLYGRVSLKEKLQITLNQKGDFQCPCIPNVVVVVVNSGIQSEIEITDQLNKLNRLRNWLLKQGSARPKKISTLLNSVRNNLAEPDKHQTSDYVNLLISKKYISVKAEEITYKL